MPRIFKLVSVGVHSVVLALVFLAQAFDVGPLPAPRNAIAYSAPIARMAPDVPLPPPRRPVTSTDHTVSIAPAPVAAPEGVRPETGREGLPSARVDPDLVSRVEGFGEPCNCIIADPLPPPAPPPAPQKPIRLHQGIQPPRKIVDVQPTYPEHARAVRQQGIVILETVIDAKGMVENVRVLRGYPLLDEAAVAAVRQWRFMPALLNGQPVPVVMTVTVNFLLQP